MSDSMEARLDSLKRKHINIDTQLREEEMRPLPDTSEIKRLKIEKMHLKEEITGLSAQN